MKAYPGLTTKTKFTQTDISLLIKLSSTVVFSCNKVLYSDSTIINTSLLQIETTQVSQIKYKQYNNSNISI